MESFELNHVDGRLYAIVVVNGETHTKDVTDYFSEVNPHDDWLDYRLGLKFV